MANIFNVVNLDNETCPVNCQNLKELLSQENIISEIVESGNGWLVKIDDCCMDNFSVLAESDFVLSGKFNNEPYYLQFEKSSLPFPEEQNFPSYNEKCTGKVEAKILLSEIPSNTTKQNLLEHFENNLPYGGKVQHIHIESGSATITFFDKEVANRVASESPIFFRGKWIDIITDAPDDEMQENEVATKTVSVHGVPEDMNLDEPQSIFENGRRSGGGKIEKEAERDTYKERVERTSASEQAKSIKPVLPARPSQAQKSQNNPEIVLGFLNKIKCNVIVNTTNNSLNLSSGAISKAILADAGPELQRECYRHPGISTYGIAVTSGYNLPCDNVFHISLPHWSQSSVSLIKTYVRNCLLKADEMKLSHIAFPAFGTGNLGYPIDMVANAMFSAVSEYMSGQNPVVQKITFVIYPKDTFIQKAFEDVKSNGPTISITKTYQSHTEKPAAAFNNIPQVAAASNKTSQDDSVSFDINGVTLILLIGSITDQNVDGIVHGTNTQFTLNGVISNSLQSLIGHQFTKDCKSKIAEMAANNYAITKAHSLPATYIVHVNIEGIRTKATQIFKLCFDGAEKHQITSLALPPLGTGGVGCSIQYFSKQLRDAVHDFAKSSPKNLKTVKIVIFNREMFGEFCREMEGIAKSTKSLFTRILSSVTNPFSKGSARQETFASKEKFPSPVSLFFYADSLNTIKEVKKKIDSEYESKYFHSTNIDDEVIKDLPHNQKLIIDSLQDKHEVKIEFMPSKIIVSGYKDDVFTVKEKINNNLMSFVKEQSTKHNAEITQRFVQWSYITMVNGKSKLEHYSTNINHRLEQAYENDKILKLQMDSKMIVFDLTNTDEMIEYPENDKNSTVKIVRKCKLEGISVPDYWTPMENVDYIKVTLTSGDEYDNVKNAFPGNFQIIKIERIQNKSLYIQYQAQLEKINSTNPQGTKNETQGLWHGTSQEVTEKINKNGFNRSYCGKNATAYGQGVYFAVNPQYSLSDTYSPPDNNGHKHIYMCNVLTGMFCRGDSNMRVPPDNPAAQGVPYNSTVDDINGPKIYVSFHDANVYPAYLITCK